MKNLAYSSFTIALCSTCVTAFGAEGVSTSWPQWRGPIGTGQSRDSRPPLSWSAHENVRWRTRVDAVGNSSPIICNNKIFISGTRPVSNSPDGSQIALVLLCYDTQTGQLAWSRTAAEVKPHERHHANGSYASASAVSDGEHVYCSFGSYGVYCYDFRGNLAWKVAQPPLKMRGEFGEGASPTLLGTSLVVNCDNEEASFIQCIDARNGSLIWKVSREERSTWSTPVFAIVGGSAHVIVSGSEATVAYNVKDGSEVWNYADIPGTEAIPSPIVVGDSVICTSGFRGKPAYCVSLSSKGRLTDYDLRWKFVGATPQVATPVVVDNRVFLIKDRLNIISCVDVTNGKLLEKTERLPVRGEVFSSPVASSNHLFVSSIEGDTAVVELKSLKVVSINRIDERLVSSLALSGRDLVMRTAEHLICFSQR